MNKTVLEKEEKIEFAPKKSLSEKMLASVPTAIVLTVVFLILGFVFDLWHPAWILFLALPVVNSVKECVIHKSIRKFCFPMFAVVVYLLSGSLFGWWSSAWIVFLMIPVFYWIF